MPWFYNSYSGELHHATGVDELAYEAALHSGTGWHELKIADSATEAQAAAEARKEVPNGTPPTTSFSKGAQNAITNNPATNALDKSLRFGLHVQGIAGWFFRGLKVLVGGILILIGISKLTGADNKITQMAAKAAPLLVAA